MKLLILFLVLINSINTPKATYYYPTIGLVTSTGCIVNPDKVINGEHKWIAVSRDFLYNKKFSLGDTVIISSDICPELNGEWILNDVMHSKWKNRIDFLLSKDQVKKFKFNNPHRVIMKKKNKR